MFELRDDFTKEELKDLYVTIETTSLMDALFYDKKIELTEILKNEKDIEIAENFMNALEDFLDKVYDPDNFCDLCN